MAGAAWSVRCLLRAPGCVSGAVGLGLGLWCCPPPSDCVSCREQSSTVRGRVRCCPVRPVRVGCMRRFGSCHVPSDVATWASGAPGHMLGACRVYGGPGMAGLCRVCVGCVSGGGPCRLLACSCLSGTVVCKSGASGDVSDVARARARVCVCVCVRVRACVRVCPCPCPCACVCVRAIKGW